MAVWVVLLVVMADSEIARGATAEMVSRSEMTLASFRVRLDLRY